MHTLYYFKLYHTNFVIPFTMCKTCMALDLIKLHLRLFQDPIRVSYLVLPG